MGILNLKELIKTIPCEPGVYLFKDKDRKIIYIGKAKNLHLRISDYLAPHTSPKYQALLTLAEDIEFIVTSSESEAMLLEFNLIHFHRPKFNIRLKDDKSYPYLKISKDTFPRVSVTRRVTKDGAIYFGPFTNVKALRQSLQFIRKYFPYRTCNTPQGPCLNYYINRCPAPCAGNISAEDYKRNIQRIISFLQGEHSKLKKEIKKKITQLSKQLDFKRAAIFKDIYLALGKIESKSKVLFNKRENMDIINYHREENLNCFVVLKIREGKLIDKDTFLIEALEEEDLWIEFLAEYYFQGKPLPQQIIVPPRCPVLPYFDQKVIFTVPKRGKKKELLEMAYKNARNYLEKQLPFRILHIMKEVLNLPVIPSRIEGFDISHFYGSEGVGSMVVFEGGRPKPSQYRRFRLKQSYGGDDIKALEEVLTRRYRKYTPPPVIFIDGGNIQLQVAKKVLCQLNYQRAIIALAKEEEIIYSNTLPVPLKLPLDNKVLQFLAQIRDEAHRFAISYHKLLRSKEFLK